MRLARTGNRIYRKSTGRLCTSCCGGTPCGCPSTSVSSTLYMTAQYLSGTTYTQLDGFVVAMTVLRPAAFGNPWDIYQGTGTTSDGVNWTATYGTDTACKVQLNSTPGSNQCFLIDDGTITVTCSPFSVVADGVFHTGLTLSGLSCPQFGGKWRLTISP